MNAVLAKQANYRVDEMLGRARTDLQAAGVESATLDARLLLQFVLGVSHEQLVAGRVTEMVEEEAHYFVNLVARRVAHEPIAKIIGTKAFWKDEFITTKDTLDPRPDTEIMIEAVLEECTDRFAPWRFLDVGTGTGCILLSLLREFPYASGVAVDKSDEALQVAQRNARNQRLSLRARFVQSDWLANVDGTFDVIVSNPPYITVADMETLPKEVKDFDPSSALVAGADGLDAYRELIPQATGRLVAGGWLFLEVGKGQAADVVEIGRNVGLDSEAVLKDLAGVERVVAFRRHIGF
jgi:release factor glutamine methyltransferase